MPRPCSGITGLFIVLSVGCTLTATAQQNQRHKDPPILNFDLQRSRSALPIHPAKPCAICSRPDIPLVFPKLGQLPGWRGRPLIPGEPGGCKCGKSRSRDKHPLFSQYWPRPFYGILEERHGNQSSCIPKFYDAFDSLKDFKLIDYQRTDNGICGNNCFGRNRDPFGCLGESRFWSQNDGRVLSGTRSKEHSGSTKPTETHESAPGPYMPQNDRITGTNQTTISNQFEWPNQALRIARYEANTRPSAPITTSRSPNVQNVANGASQLKRYPLGNARR